jgi:polyisoprenoid-binding protein YceI
MKHLLAVFFVLAAFPALAAERYSFDKDHTSINFEVSHLGFSEMTGRFMDYDGHFMFNEKEPEKSAVDVVIRPSGVSTISKGLDEHLQKDDFFNTAKYPEVRFVSTAVQKTGPNTGDISGNLTLLGVTKPVVLKAVFNKADWHPMTKDYIAGFSATTAIKRSEFGMDKYVPMVGDEVRFDIEVEGVNEEKKATKAEKH